MVSAQKGMSVDAYPPRSGELNLARPFKAGI
jgi:hypothetical protein